MIPNWDNLQYLLALGRSKSVAIAARQLKVSEITVRRRITAIEAFYGVPLFERADGNYDLTRAGSQLFETALRMENTLERGIDLLSGMNGLPAGHVRVGAPDGLGTYRIAPALARLQSTLPELTIELLTLPREADFARREVDIGIVPRRPDGAGDHRMRAVDPVTIYLYASQSYLDLHPPIGTIADLAGHRFVGYPAESEFAEPMNLLLRKLELEVRPSFSSMNVMVQAHASAHGGGLALLPDYAAEPHRTMRRILPDQVSSNVPIWMIIHRKMHMLARVRAVSAAIIAAMAG